MFDKKTVILKSLVEGQDEPDLYAVDDFMWIMVELLATAAA